VTGDPSSDDARLDAWLTARRDAVTASLREVLDLEAGLRDATLGGHHAAMVGELAESLDVESGLAAIRGTRTEEVAPPGLPAPPDGLPPDVPPFLAHDHWVLAARITPAERLALRDHPARYPAVFAALTVCAVGLVRDAARERPAQDTVAKALRLSEAAKRACADARTLRHPELAQMIGQVPALLALVATLRADRRFDKWRQHAFAERRAALNLARALHLTVHHARDGIQVAGDPQGYAHVLGEAEHFASLVHRRLDEAVSGTGEVDRRTVERAYGAARLADRELTKCLVPGPAFHPPAIALELLDPRVVDDFTTADLSDADLTSTDLTGVRWSPRGTRWPPTVDVTALLARSQEDPLGSGLYVVRPPTGRDTFHRTPV
jgi:hypothetical protein